VTPEELDGPRVYDAGQEWTGDVSKVVTRDDGKIETVIVDIGGFLGIGEKSVGLSPENIEIMRNESVGELKVNVTASKVELKSMNEYEG